MKSTVAELDNGILQKVFFLTDHHVHRTPITGPRMRFRRGKENRLVGSSQDTDGPLGKDFVLADIQLADGSSGMNAVDDILRQRDVPIVFITAFPEKLLTGNASEPAFLLTKPFDEDMLKALISQILLFQPSKAEIS